MDKQGNLRLVLAIAISFLVIALWSKFFPPEVASDSTTPQTTEAKDKPSDIPSSLADSQQAIPGVDATAALVSNKNIISRVEGEDFELEIDSKGNIVQVYLKADKYTQPPQEGILTHIGRIFGTVVGEPAKLEKLALLGENSSLYPLQIFFVDGNLRELASKTPYTADKSHISLKDGEQILSLTQNLGEITVEKRLTIKPNMTYKVEINLSKPTQYIISNGMRPEADGESYAFQGVLLQKTDTTIEKIEDGDAKIEGQNYDNALYIASVDRYYTSLMFTEGAPLSVIVGSHGKGMPRPFINLKEQNETLYGYIGPKDYNLLQSINPNLTSVVEYGRITFFAKYIFTLLDFLYKHIGNWGVAIIVLTLIVRIILFPLSFKGMVGMQKLKDLAPKMKELQEKYKDNPQKLQSSMMELYKKHGANPLGGCLPLILQIPVFFAIYRVLYNAVELKNAPFFAWIHDLSVMDPYFIFPVLMGISMYVQQVLTPTAINDPLQAKVFKWLPVIFTLFLITFPAGLILYWTINNVISIVQQLVINKLISLKQKETGKN